MRLLKEKFYWGMAGLTTLILTSPVFSATTGTTGTSGSGAISSGVGEVANDIGNASKEAISNTKYVLAFAMLILLVILVIGGALGAYFWYKNTRGNPQQPANTVNALIWSAGGVIAGVITWVLLEILLKQTIGLDIVAVLKQSFGG